MPITLRLTAILKERNMTQKQLSELSGLRPGTISHLCSKGVNSVYFDTLEIVCQVLEIDLHDLLILEKA